MPVWVCCDKSSLIFILMQENNSEKLNQLQEQIREIAEALDELTGTVKMTVEAHNELLKRISGTKAEVSYDKSFGSDILEYINSRYGRSFKVFNDSERSKLKARLKEGYTMDDIFSAIDNAHSTDHHIESGYRYLTPEFFTRKQTLDRYKDGRKGRKMNEL